MARRRSRPSDGVVAAVKAFIWVGAAIALIFVCSWAVGR